MKLPSCLFLIFFLFVSCGNDDIPLTQNDPEPESEKPKGEDTFPEEYSENLLLQLEGTQLVDANKNTVYLQGVAFNNFIWENSALPPAHHTEIDYERVRSMGMNTIRFYMNYHYFEDDSDPYTYRQSGWDWLDQNIAWAKKHGIYLVLNMHVPQGGYQSQGEGDALWTNTENQNRLAALWKEIAKRYVNEVQIAGFGPVNEPVPTQSIDQWSQLAQKIIDAIRSVNRHHLIFLEKAIYVKGAQTDTNLNFPSVTGNNLIYEFHGYDPYFYTHQLLEFADLGDGGSYPDETVLEISESQWYTASFDNPSLPSGTTEWEYFEGVLYEVADPNIDIGIPALVGENVGGRVYFDDIIVTEYDENGDFVRTIYEANLTTLESWSYWSRNESGIGAVSNLEGRNDSNSLYIEGATTDANMSNYGEVFETRANHSYQISGWMKGENVAGNAECKIRLDFYSVDGPVLRRNRAYLESVIEKMAHWAKNRNAPLYMGEFGAGYPCFQDEKGGLDFVKDMVDIAKTNNIHFTYHAYHEDAFGLYLGFGLPDPSNVNQPLIDLFTEILNQ
ncbi:glycoside hydrolase family 5 protein [Flavobacteriaceae bacterium TP-CH-4]|uniref:Glycoside hydrolase family 5 protein n=1 Tax=Pelagihabitans pacificus TaxID=2696054 RepID=A0A967AU37_9FLAO|nr:cellulase family glycosylhydrolase [Pelagihabitans pacificus]NHF59038.1 glycoside hydrolase family 5 protein [Pelagihabitans pacificus]